MIERERERERESSNSRGTVVVLLFREALRFRIRTEGTCGIATLLPVRADRMAVINPPMITVNMVAIMKAIPSAMASAMASITAVSTVMAKMYTTRREEKGIHGL